MDDSKAHDGIDRAVEVARTWLFVPGNRPERFEKALASTADEVILDLEDAVSAQHKPAARANAAQWLSEVGSAWLRVNAIGTPYYSDDIDAIGQLSGLRGIVVSKAEDPAALMALRERLHSGARLIALIESALGVHRAVDIAQSGAVARLAFGALDFAEDISAELTPETLSLPRQAIVLASRIGRLAAPIDGVSTNYQDTDVVFADTRNAASLGFGAKLCIHPAQLEPVRRGFTPDLELLQWARTVLLTSNQTPGATALDGAMIDKPVLDRARRILARAGELVKVDVEANQDNR